MVGISQSGRPFREGVQKTPDLGWTSFLDGPYSETTMATMHPLLSDDHPTLHQPASVVDGRAYPNDCNFFQEDACDVEVTAEDAVNDLADKLAQVSEMLKAKRKVPASLGLNHSAGAALKIVDRAYQNQTVPAHPASNQLFQVVAPCLRGAYTRVVALMEDRNETTDMLTRFIFVPLG